jgi:uncharacterized protein YcgL (UPF0745 family)
MQDLHFFSLPISFLQKFLVHKAEQMNYLSEKGFQLQPPPPKNSSIHLLQARSTSHESSSKDHQAPDTLKSNLVCIKSRPFYSILWDGGSDISKKPKAAFMIRHLRNPSTVLKESFVELLMRSATAATETESILQQLVKVGYLLSAGMDGASVN